MTAGREREDAVLVARQLQKRFGDNRVLFEIDLQIARGQIVALVGPSGCGKSTLLNLIAGTLFPTQGVMLVRDGGVLTAVNAPGSDRGMVYQRYALFPFLTAQQNVALGPILAGSTLPERFMGLVLPKVKALKQSAMAEAATLLERVGLGAALDRYPHELSGGMRQRVAITQALIMKPSVLLMDEPFGALDEATREDLQSMLLGFYQENIAAKARGDHPLYTILMVTHELNEALYVSDRVLGLSQYWDWKAQGHATCPGATILYDQQAPVYLPDDERDGSQLKALRREIRALVFEEDSLPSRHTHVTFWDQVDAGHGQGVLAP
jgi:NitT/TauT family transport system ATP-binding protein